MAAKVPSTKDKFSELEHPKFGFSKEKIKRQDADGKSYLQISSLINNLCSQSVQKSYKSMRRQ